MKLRQIGLIILSSLSLQAFSSERKDITVLEVGLSKVSGRVFVKGTPSATTTDCTGKDHYSIALGDPEAYLFYSAALTAMKQGTKMRVQYEQQNCIGSGPVVDVFWNLPY